MYLRTFIFKLGSTNIIILCFIFFLVIDLYNDDYLDLSIILKT